MCAAQGAAADAASMLQPDWQADVVAYRTSRDRAHREAGNRRRVLGGAVILWQTSERARQEKALKELAQDLDEGISRREHSCRGPCRYAIFRHGRRASGLPQR